MPGTKNLELYYLHRPVADITALKAVNTTSIVDGEVVNISGLGTWQFIKASAAVADDITIVQPTAGGGRWIKQTIIEADGTVKLPKNLNANSKQLKSLLDPSDPQDATTKSWVESQISVENLWDRTGTILTPHNSGDTVYTPYLFQAGRADSGVFVDGLGYSAIGKNITGDAMDANNWGWFFLAENSIICSNKKAGVDTTPFELNLATNVFAFRDASDNLTYSFNRLTGTATYYGIQSYNSHPSFSADTDIPDKKYIDDHPGAAINYYDDLSSQILVGGETSFTISNPPNTPNEALLFLNGQKRTYGGGADFSISGTTLTWNNPSGLTLVVGDKLHVYYNYSLGGAPLNQLQIYYVGEAGDDTFNGKNYHFPVKTLGQAITLVNAQTPSSTNRFEIQIIGGMILTQNITIPQYTKIVGLSAKLIGTATFSTGSELEIEELVAPLSGNGLVANGVTANATISKLSSLGSSVGIYAHNAGVLRVNVEEIDCSAASSKAYNLATGGVLYLDCKKLRENVASTDDGTGTSFFNVSDYGSGADTYIYNDTGDVILQPGSNIILKDSLGNEVLTNLGKYHKFTNAPSFEAYKSAGAPNVTGDGSTVTVLFDNVITNNGSHYNAGTGTFTAPVAGEYLFTYTIALDGFSDHTLYELYLVAGVKTYYSYFGSPLYTKTPGGTLYLNGSHKVYLNSSDAVYVRISAGGGSLALSVDLLGSNLNKFSGILLTV